MASFDKLMAGYRQLVKAEYLFLFVWGGCVILSLVAWSKFEKEINPLFAIVTILLIFFGGPLFMVKDKRKRKMFFECQRCGKSLLALFSRGVVSNAPGNRLSFCPYCGASVENEDSAVR